MRAWQQRQRRIASSVQQRWAGHAAAAPPPPDDVPGCVPPSGPHACARARSNSSAIMAAAETLFSPLSLRTPCGRQVRPFPHRAQPTQATNPLFARPDFLSTSSRTVLIPPPLDLTITPRLLARCNIAVGCCLLKSRRRRQATGGASSATGEAFCGEVGDILTRFYRFVAHHWSFLSPKTPSQGPCG